VTAHNDAEAMIAHLEAMEVLARIHGWDVLAYLIVMARIEAQIILRDGLDRT
jgi:hypothetical protein